MSLAILWRTFLNLLIVAGVLFLLLSVCVGAPMILGEWFWIAYLIGMGGFITFLCYWTAKGQVEEKNEAAASEAAETAAADKGEIDE